MRSNEDDFFEEQTPVSRLKSKIVSKYFFGWANIIGSVSGKIGYADYFAGPGKYEDGSDSTPLLILKPAIENPKLANSLTTWFNDKSKENIIKLQTEIGNLPKVNQLRYLPDYENITIDHDIIKSLSEKIPKPSLIFIDPFGYKGLSLQLIESAIKKWGCDCIFFFNYNRINAAMSNPSFENNVDLIYGKEVADNLRMQVKGLPPPKRERLLLDTLMNVLKGVKGQYSIKFKFYQPGKRKTSHFLILVTKHQKGYFLMKEIMAKESNEKDSIPTYEFNPLKGNIKTDFGLFEGRMGPIVDLANELCNLYKGRTLTVKEIYELHGLDKPYYSKNYKSALLHLEHFNRIIADPPAAKRPKRLGILTMGDLVKIIFLN